MTVEQANGNYNYMYEFRIDKSWYPCHLLNDSVENGHCMIFTRNGSIISERLNDVRKMRKKIIYKTGKKLLNGLGNLLIIVVFMKI